VALRTASGACQKKKKKLLCCGREPLFHQPRKQQLTRVDVVRCRLTVAHIWCINVQVESCQGRHHQQAVYQSERVGQQLHARACHCARLLHVDRQTAHSQGNNNSFVCICRPFSLHCVLVLYGDDSIEENSLPDLVSDIAIFVLKRDVKLQLTNLSPIRMCCMLLAKSCRQ